MQNSSIFTPWADIPKTSHFLFFSFIFLWVVVYMYLCRPSEASTRYCVIPGGYPPQDWQSLPCAGEELDSNPGLLICSQVRYHWASLQSGALPLSQFAVRCATIEPFAVRCATIEPRQVRYHWAKSGALPLSQGALPLSQRCATIEPFSWQWCVH